MFRSSYNSYFITENQAKTELTPDGNVKRDLNISFIIPGITNPEEWEKTRRTLLPAAQCIQLVAFEDLPGIEEFFFALVLPGKPPSGFAEMLNRALPHLTGEFVTILPPGIELPASLPDMVSDAAHSGGVADYLYGHYRERLEDGSTRIVESNPCPDDITEREDWGMLEFYRVSALRQINGCPPNLKFRPDYDLRLKLTCHKQGVLIPEPICTITTKSQETEVAASALFFPGRGKFGGFSYLFMDPDEEKEVEAIFYSALKQRKAFLSQQPDGRFLKSKEFSPRVTVIIPVHNRAKFLPLAVGSIQKGTFSDFEIVIVDNASEDNTLEVANQLAIEDKRIQVVSLPDNIIARALNAGVNRAKGEYIAQLDSDDEYNPRTLEAMVKQLDANLDWGLAISYYELMDEHGTTLTDFGIIKHLEYNRNNILRVDGAGAVRVWRKAAIDEFDGFNEEDFGHYGEDYDLVLKVGEKYEVGRVHEVLYRYRRHPGNSDVLRSHDFKLGNKTLARQRAILRRSALK
jgi:hypothetical protein